MFDLKEIIDLLPFIAENPSKSIYIIVVSIAFGFVVGRAVGKMKTKSRIQLESENSKLIEENKELKAENSLARIASPSPFTTLADLDKLVNSEKGEVALSAIIEFSVKSNSTKKPE